MKVLLKTVVVIIVILVLITGSFVLLSNRERSLATNFAVGAVTKVLKDPKIASTQNIPINLRLVSRKPVDTDLFERTWIFWFKLEPQGSIMISVIARRGISFFPLFNTHKTLEVHRIDYEP